MSQRRRREDMRGSEGSSDKGSESSEGFSEGFSEDEKQDAQGSGSRGKHFYQYDSEDDDDDDDDSDESEDGGDDHDNDDIENNYDSSDDGDDDSEDSNDYVDARDRSQTQAHINIPLAERLRQQEANDLVISSSNAPSLKRKQRKNRDLELGGEKTSADNDQGKKDLKRRNKHAPSVMPSNRAVKRFRENPNLSKSFKPHDPR